MVLTGSVWRQVGKTRHELFTYVCARVHVRSRARAPVSARPRHRQAREPTVTCVRACAHPPDTGPRRGWKSSEINRRLEMQAARTLRGMPAGSAPLDGRLCPQAAAAESAMVREKHGRRRAMRARAIRFFVMAMRLCLVMGISRAQSDSSTASSFAESSGAFESRFGKPYRV